MKNEDIKILVVDDEDMLRTNLKMELEFDNYCVFEANSGNEAFKIIQSQDFHLVLSDVRMPDGDGVDLLKSISKMSKNRPYVFLISGFSHITSEEAKELGAVDLLNKPLDIEVIYDFISNNLR